MKPWKWIKAALLRVARFWKGIPRSWKLAVDVLIILLVLVGTWAILGYPSFSAGMAYRRAVVDAGYPASEMELFTEQEGRIQMGIGTDGNNTYGVQLVRDSTSKLWKFYTVWSLPAAEGIWYTDLRWDCSGYSFFPRQEDEKTVFAYAVKAPGASAELTLTLEDWYYASTSSSISSVEWHGGSYSFVLEEARDGWFLFAFDQDFLMEQLNSEENPGRDAGRYDAEPVKSYVNWIQSYYSRIWMLPPAHLTLVTYDENGAMLNTVTWDPVAVGAPYG